MKKILIAMVVCLMLCGCGKSDGIEEIMKKNEYVIVDVRADFEYKTGHLVGAINIPYDEIDENVNLDKDKVIFVYCKSGNRSSIAYETLTNLGYTVYDLGAFSEIDLPKE